MNNLMQDGACCQNCKDGWDRKNCRTADGLPCNAWRPSYELLQSINNRLQEQNAHLLWQLNAVRDILTGERKEVDIYKEPDSIKGRPAHEAYFEAFKVMDKLKILASMQTLYKHGYTVHLTGVQPYIPDVGDMQPGWFFTTQPLVEMRNSTMMKPTLAELAPFIDGLARGVVEDEGGKHEQD